MAGIDKLSKNIDTPLGKFRYFSLSELSKDGHKVDELPFSIRIILKPGDSVTTDHFPSAGSITENLMAYDILNLAQLQPNMKIKVMATRSDGTKFEFRTVAKLDSSMEVAYFKSNGILQYVLRSFLKAEEKQSLENNKPKLK